MLKLPKGLKKKKKDKKSKKNQELFTEEELEQFKREQRARQLAEQQQEGEEQQQVDQDEQHNQQQPSQQQQQQQQQPQSPQQDIEKSKTEDDEWSKFKSLTTGIDSVLKTTQGNLHRIKESSFFQRIDPPKPKQEEPKPEEIVAEAENVEGAAGGTDKESNTENKLAELEGAVIELSESEEESDDGDDIFDTNYIDSLTGVLAYVPDSPEEADEGPDPFDTAYAEKIIKGPEVSKRGKKIVNIGSAVEVLTGRVEKVNTKALKRPRRGIQNLLLESFDKDSEELRADCCIDSVLIADQPVHTLLDDPADELPDIPIDLSTSLHLQFQQQKQKEEGIELVEPFGLEFEKDEFDDLAAESLTKKDEVIVVQEISCEPVITDTGDWSAFEGEPHPADIVEVDDIDIPVDDDIFDTAYVATVIKENSIDDDDFDPRAGEEREEVVVLPSSAALKVQLPDLLSGSTNDLNELSHVPVISASDTIDVEKDFDPFDTSAISSLVQPKEAEIKFLEKELLTESFLKHSLSDPDFDPRVDEQLPLPQTVSERKSSLSLNIAAAGIHNKSVGFSIPSGLTVHNPDNKVQKPLTPYYSNKSFDEAADVNEEEISDSDFNPRERSENEPKPDLLAVSVSHDIKVLTPSTKTPFDQTTSISDPFDTSNVSKVLVPGRTELKLLENELIESREPDKTAVLDTNTDSQELGLGDKVLTPHVCLSAQESIEDIDPFDTSFANNIAPGQAEIKLLESELIHK